MDKIDNKIMLRGRRVSLTFRQIRHNACDCQYKDMCDSQVEDVRLLKVINSKVANENRKGIFMDLVNHTEEEKVLLNRSKQA